MDGGRQRLRLEVFGTVQGVGFRPFVYRLASEEELSGFVRNDGGAAVLEVEGPPARLERFARRLVAELPPPGRVERVETEALPAAGATGPFVIAASATRASTTAALAPDGAICGDCRRELGDPHDRRYRHPFITCTRCGPRYTITRALPYDRPNTTLARFPLCADCRREYDDPFDRRHHAQPLSCPHCGPRAWLVPAGADPAPPPQRDPDPAAAIDAARELLLAGRVVAIKGVGGFHLAADARNPGAVARLRRLKRRPRKPLAVMARDLAVARELASIDAEAEALLASHAAPIVLAAARRPSVVCDAVAPGLDDVGLLLPYSGIHLLLFDGVLDAVVLTSGNPPSEPIATADAEALATLGADAFLLHDREIHVACDDSVVRVGAPAGARAAATAVRADGPVLVRRSRGHVPRGLDASFLPRRSVLALGAELKVALATLARGELVLGRHLGDLDNSRSQAAFEAEIGRMLDFARLEPELVAVDLHPDLFGSAYAARAFAGVPRVRVQHHHAHLAAVLVEHAVPPGTRACGIVLDGFGLGTDGTVWGGEVLVGSYAGFERAAHLRPVAQPGGDRAALEPVRMATSHLVDAGLGAPGWPGYDERFAAVARVREVSPPTSSAGRLFDAAAAILGIAPAVQDYEGEAPALVESAADPTVDDAYPLPLAAGVLDTRALVAALAVDRAPVPVRAARFHNGLADGLAAAALATGVPLVALGGGSMVNRLLRRRLAARLASGGARVLLPEALPAGDGGLAAGQAACAACSPPQ